MKQEIMKLIADHGKLQDRISKLQEQDLSQFGLFLPNDEWDKNPNAKRIIKSVSRSVNNNIEKLMGLYISLDSRKKK